MGNIIRGTLLMIMILLLVMLVPSPALTEGMNAAEVIPIPIDAPQAYPVDESYYVSEMEYKDPTLHIVIEKDVYMETEVWIARVKIAHPSQLRTAMAGQYGSRQTTRVSIMANRSNAVLAINGDYYNFIHYGVVLRQGHMYRHRPIEQYDLLLIDDQGDFHPVLNANMDTFNPVYESFGGAWDEGGHLINILTFGPVLIMDGKLAHEDFKSPENGANKLAQRMVIAQDGPLSYLCVSTEGPESDSRGLKLSELADYILGLGCHTAYNLDGGSSSTMVFHGEKINSLETKKVRSVSDIVYFASAIQP